MAALPSLSPIASASGGLGHHSTRFSIRHLRIRSLEDLPMPYPESMRQSLRLLEASRTERMREVFPRMSPEEKTELLHAFHPDFRLEGMREIKVGPNKGDRTPHEFADQLEARSRIDPDRIDLDRIDHDVDVLVIGGGGGGSAAALLARENGASVLLAT